MELLLPPPMSKANGREEAWCSGDLRHAELKEYHRDIQAEPPRPYKRLNFMLSQLIVGINFCHGKDTPKLFISGRRFVQTITSQRMEAEIVTAAYLTEGRADYEEIGAFATDVKGGLIRLKKKRFLQLDQLIMLKSANRSALHMLMPRVGKAVIVQINRRQGEAGEIIAMARLTSSDIRVKRCSTGEGITISRVAELKLSNMRKDDSKEALSGFTRVEEIWFGRPMSIRSYGMESVVDTPVFE